MIVIVTNYTYGDVMTKAFLILLGSLFSIQLLAHSGGTDRNGCHHDRKNGGYHCHKSSTHPKKPQSETEKVTPDQTAVPSKGSKKPASEAPTPSTH